MFFSISRSPKLNFSVNGHYHRGWHLDMDAGWHIAEHNRKTVAWKGYLDHGDLDLEIYKIVDEDISRSGNYCAIVLDDDTARIHHSLYRSFPLWYDPDYGVTNLQPLSRRIFADSAITLFKDLSFHTDQVNVIQDIPDQESTFDAVVNTVDEMLTEKFDYFFSVNDLPVKIFLSGGIDTTLMLGYLQKLEIPHEVVLAEHVDFDRFWVMNHNTIVTNHWAYQQMHHWKNPTILVSGCPGDEFTLRNPSIANMLALHHGTSINELFARSGKENLHQSYFRNDENQKKFLDQSCQAPIADRQTLYQTILDQAINDHQHWHLGNTLTFTPMRDLLILKQFLTLPWNHQVEQMLDASVSRALIARQNPDLLQLLSAQKNTGNYLSPLAKLL